MTKYSRLRNYYPAYVFGEQIIIKIADAKQVENDGFFATLRRLLSRVRTQLDALFNAI